MSLAWVYLAPLYFTSLWLNKYLPKTVADVRVSECCFFTLQEPLHWCGSGSSEPVWIENCKIFQMVDGCCFFPWHCNHSIHRMKWQQTTHTLHTVQPSIARGATTNSPHKMWHWFFNALPLCVLSHRAVISEAYQRSALIHIVPLTCPEISHKQSFRYF